MPNVWNAKDLQLVLETRLLNVSDYQVSLDRTDVIEWQKYIVCWSQTLPAELGGMQVKR
jgi:hypothetical protein